VKLQAERAEGSNAITRHSSEGVVVNGQTYRESLIVPWQGEVIAWSPNRFEALTAADFDTLQAMNPELVLFGSGAKLRFAHPQLLQGLMRHRIGLETMDTAAACRTYNVLLAEGRRVVAALLFEPKAL
jgi:uncharacterized protein